MIQVRNLRLLNLTVFLIVMIMIIISYISMPNGQTKAAAIALCAAFGLVQGLDLGKQTLLAGWRFTLLLRHHHPDPIESVFPARYFQLLFLYPHLRGGAGLAYTTSDSLGNWLLFAQQPQRALESGNWGHHRHAILCRCLHADSNFRIHLRQAEIARNKNEELLEELNTTQLQLQNMAVNEERTRMAREMHDSLGHRLTVSIVQLEGAQRLIPTEPERAARMIGAMRDEMKEALAELRRTVTALRVPIADDASLDIALSTLTQTFQQNTGIPTHFSVSPGFPELPATHRLALYRAAQEALTNIQRHAMAEHAWLELNADDQNITLVMQDDGKGIGPPSKNSPVPVSWD
jgi:signal transduction histidine kinase